MLSYKNIFPEGIGVFLKKNRKKVLPTLWEYIVLSIGTLLYCVAWTAFLIPNDIASGGLTGACTILQFAFGIPIAYSFFIANIFLLGMGFLILGNAFGFKTIYAILLSTVLFKFLPDLEWLKAVPGNFLYVKDTILLPIIGGVLEAIGISYIFKRGGSTGGTDVLALIINKFWPVSPGRVYLISDLFIISSILLLPGRHLQDMVYGYITMITFSIGIDALLMGSKSTMQVLVFSNKNHEIGDYILKELDRGVTALKSVGWFTKEEKNVLLIIIRKRQLSELTKAIKEIDKNAFVSVSQASSVYGTGFDEIKTGISKKKKIIQKSMTDE